MTSKRPCVHMVSAFKNRIIDVRSLLFHSPGFSVKLRNRQLALPELCIAGHFGAKRLPCHADLISNIFQNLQLFKRNAATRNKEADFVRFLKGNQSL